MALGARDRRRRPVRRPDRELPERRRAACRAASRWSARSSTAPPAARRSSPTTTCRCSPGWSLRGRCRTARPRISARYPLVELLTLTVFAVVVAVNGFDEDLLLELPFVSGLIALAGHRLRPQAAAQQDRLSAGGVGPDRNASSWTATTSSRTSPPARGVRVPADAVIAYPRGMGMGDVKLAGAMGLYLGPVGDPGPAGRLPVGLDRRARG